MRLVTSSLIGLSMILALSFGSSVLAKEAPKVVEASSEQVKIKSPVKMTQAIQIKVNINTAPIDELSKLKGIGQVKAKAIVDYRTTHGKFSSIEALINVPGIGNKLIEQNRAWMSL